MLPMHVCLLAQVVTGTSKLRYLWGTNPVFYKAVWDIKISCTRKSGDRCVHPFVLYKFSKSARVKQGCVRQRHGIPTVPSMSTFGRTDERRLCLCSHTHTHSSDAWLSQHSQFCCRTWLLYTLMLGWSKKHYSVWSYLLLVLFTAPDCWWQTACIHRSFIFSNHS